MSEGLRKMPVHRALHRPDLMLGCERELLLITGLITLTLVVVAFNWLAAIIGVTIWTVVVGLLRSMAKVDPFMSKVYLRHIKYKPFYPARSSPFAPGAKHTREK